MSNVVGDIILNNTDEKLYIFTAEGEWMIIESEITEKKKEFYLEPDEVVCDKCNGTGVEHNHLDYLEEEEYKKFQYIPYDFQCKKCYGSRKLTWLENVLGKEQTHFIGHTGYSGYGISGYTGTSGMVGVSGHNGFSGSSGMSGFVVGASAYNFNTVPNLSIIKPRQPDPPDDGIFSIISTIFTSLGL